MIAYRRKIHSTLKNLQLLGIFSCNKSLKDKKKDYHELGVSSISLESFCDLQCYEFHGDRSYYLFLEEEESFFKDPLVNFERIIPRRREYCSSFVLRELTSYERFLVEQYCKKLNNKEKVVHVVKYFSSWGYVNKYGSFITSFLGDLNLLEPEKTSPIYKKGLCKDPVIWINFAKMCRELYFLISMFKKNIRFSYLKYSDIIVRKTFNDSLKTLRANFLLENQLRVMLRKNNLLFQPSFYDPGVFELEKQKNLLPLYSNPAFPFKGYNYGMETFPSSSRLMLHTGRGTNNINIPGTNNINIPGTNNINIPGNNVVLKSQKDGLKQGLILDRTIGYTHLRKIEKGKETESLLFIFRYNNYSDYRALKTIWRELYPLCNLDAVLEGVIRYSKPKIRDELLFVNLYGGCTKFNCNEIILFSDNPGI